MPTKRTKGTLPSGSVRYQLYIGTDAQGKRTYKSFTARTKTEAKKLADKWQEEHEISSNSAPKSTFSDVANTFIANRSKTLSPSTLADYSKRIRMIEREYPDFAATKVQVITSEDVQILINQMSSKPSGRTGKPISPKTISNYYQLICAILGSQGVTLKSVRLPQRKKTELVIPENEEVSRLLQVIKGTDMEIPVLLAAWGPMRRGEICALKMDDIDFEKRTVHVCRSMVLDKNKSWVVKVPKSYAGDRVITYPAYLIDLIKDKGYITRSNPQTISHNFIRTLQRHGLRKFRFHDLRHFSASFQIALGIPPEYIMERGGWSTPGTMQRYVHALDEQRRQMADKTNDAFSKLM